MDTNTESWRPVIGYEGCYEVSDFGRVRAIHAVNRFAKPSIRVLKQNLTVWGYKTVSLCRNGKYTSRTVHRVVLESFVSMRPEGMEVSHLDGDKQNNSLPNLQWETHSENVKRRTLHGTASKPWSLCKRGHALTEDNVYHSKNGTRKCKLCTKINGSNRDQAARYQRDKARAAIAKAGAK